MDIMKLVTRAREAYRATKNAHDDKVVEYENTINTRATDAELLSAERMKLLKRGNDRYYVQLA